METVNRIIFLGQRNTLAHIANGGLHIKFMEYFQYIRI